MARYFYDRHVVETSTYYTQGSWETLRDEYVGADYSMDGYSSFSLNQETGKFSESGHLRTLNINNHAGVYWVTGGGSRLNKEYGYFKTASVFYVVQQTCEAVLRTSYSRGTYIDTITAEDGTYPDNGRVGDYWYVKGARAFPQLAVKSGGQVKQGIDGWVKVDGELKRIVRLWTKTGGQLKES